MKRFILSLILSLVAAGFLNSHAQTARTDTMVLHINASIPAFLFEGDRLELPVFITNKSDSEITGQAALQLFDAVTNTAVDGWFQNVFPMQYFTVASGKTEVVQFPVEVPYLFHKTVQWRAVAGAGNVKAFEEGTFPVLTTKSLVTERLPLPITGDIQHFTFQKLLQADAATEQQALTVELFSNSIWHVVQALPFITGPKTENAIAAFNQFYTYALATKIRATFPKVNALIESWKQNDTMNARHEHAENQEFSAIASQMQLAAARSDTDEKQYINAFFDSAALQKNLVNSVEGLKQLQHENGSFSWFTGGPEDRFITQCIVTGIGRLKKLQALSGTSDNTITEIVKPALSYLDQKMAATYEASLKNKTSSKTQQLQPLQVQYLYLRSFFADAALPQIATIAYPFYLQQAQKHWQAESPMLQAMRALALYRGGQKQTAVAIVQSLKKGRSMQKKNTASESCWQAPVEEKALLLEAFREITGETPTTDSLQKSLLSQKAGNTWKTGSTTVAACYALVLNSPPETNALPALNLKLGTAVLSNTQNNAEHKAGYFKKIITPPQLQPAMGNIESNVKQQSPSPARRPQLEPVLYWQYFNDGSVETSKPVHISKQILQIKNGKSSPLQDGSLVQVNDTLKVRLTILADRNLEYVQVKDRYAAAMEPVGFKTGYQTQHGVGFYGANSTAGMQFIIPVLHNGQHIFEYTVLVKRAGTFGNGIATVESVFAPGLTAQSNAIRFQVE